MNDNNDGTEPNRDSSNNPLPENVDGRDGINQTILEVVRELTNRSLNHQTVFEPDNAYVSFSQEHLETALPGTTFAPPLNSSCPTINKEKVNAITTRDSSYRTEDHVPTTHIQESNDQSSTSRTTYSSAHSVISIPTDIRIATAERSTPDSQSYLSSRASVYHGPPPLIGAPPAYSAIIRIEPHANPWLQRNRPQIQIQPSPPFIAPIPPPSYNEAQGFHLDRPIILASASQLTWGPHTLSVICPRCAHVVDTRTEARRSNLSHVTALVLCLCGCWPCCLIPYCMDYCKNVNHYCPTCQQVLGTYRPW